MTDKMKLVLRYPLLKDMRSEKKVSDIEKVFDILVKCIHEVHDGDKVYNAIDVTKDDLNTFVEQMTTGQLQKVMDFFDTMPKLHHEIKYKNSLDHDRTIVLNSVKDFFMLG